MKSVNLKKLRNVEMISTFPMRLIKGIKANVNTDSKILVTSIDQNGWILFSRSKPIIKPVITAGTI